MTLALTRWDGIAFRAHHPKWAYAPASGEGARQHGGRFNRPGVTALYLALSVEGAWTEAQQGFPFKAQPMTMCAYRVASDRMLDLSSTAACLGAGIDTALLACPWEDLAGRGQPVPSWELADQLIAAGADGMLAPSFAPGAPAGAGNLILWRWSGADDARVEVIDDFARLPRNPSSWA